MIFIVSRTSKDLGKLISTHGTAPQFLQRAAIVAVVSFLFFLGTLVAFYIRQELGYFVLSTAFLVVYMFTMIGIWMQKRSSVRIYENGIAYKKFTAAWDEIGRVESSPEKGISISKDKKNSVVLPRTIVGLDVVARTIRSKLPG